MNNVNLSEPGKPQNNISYGDIVRYANDNRNKSMYCDFLYNKPGEAEPMQYIACKNGFITMIANNGSIFQAWAGELRLLKAPPDVQPIKEARQ